MKTLSELDAARDHYVAQYAGFTAARGHEAEDRQPAPSLLVTRPRCTKVARA